MAIPPQYNGSLLNWFATTVSQLSQINRDFAVFTDYWPNLTTGQKTALKTDAIAKIAEQQTQLTNIISHINSVPV